MSADLKETPARFTAAYLDGEPRAVATVDDWLRRAALPFRRRLRNDWEDLLQELRMEVFRLLQQGRFRGDSSLKTYVWRVASHTCLDHCRARARRRGDEVDVEGEMERLPPRPAGQGTRTVERDLLLRVLAETSDECRKLWEMVVAGLSYREMSDRTGVSEGALRVRVLRCRKRAAEVRERLLDGDVASGG